MRVLYLGASGQMGGTEASVLALMQTLQELHPEWQLSLVLGEDGPFAARAARQGVDVRVLPFSGELALLGFGERSSPGRIGRVLRSLAAALRYRIRLQAAIRLLRPDIIHSIGFKMHLLVATISRRKLEGARLCHVHDYLGRGFLKRWIWRIALSRYDRVVAVSRSVAADLRAIPLPERKITSIHNGIRIQQFSPTGKKLDLDRLSGLTEGDTDLVRVGLVATFAKWKGHITFMRAMALLRDLKVCGYVIGGPIYQTLGSQHTLDELRAAAEKYCPNIRLGFTGGVEDVAAAYRSLDIVVHASTSPEPFGMVIIEAMACGKPVIVSRGGGAAEIFEDGVTGLAHDPGDAAMLARQIVRLTGDAGLRTQLGDNGHAAVAARFQASAMAASFAELYSEMAAATQVAACARPEGGKRCFA